MAQIVDPQLAAECTEMYTKIYENYHASAITNAYTDSVSFPFDSLLKFITAASSNADTLKIKFGVYTPEFAAKYKVQEGRLTAFLYTTSSTGLGDPPDNVYNMGDPSPPAPVAKP